MSSPGGFSIEPSVKCKQLLWDRHDRTHRDVQKGVKNRDPTEWEIGPGRAGRVNRGYGDSPWCNVGLMLVILGAVEQRREAMRTVEKECLRMMYFHVESVVTTVLVGMHPLRSRVSICPDRARRLYDHQLVRLAT
jgi:hypothetical protein